MKFEIRARFTGSVLFEADLEASFENECYGIQLGAAVKLAVKAGANLAGASLAGANLAGANLAGAYLAGANLAGANLAGANLAGAYLAGANLAGAYLARADLARASLAGANLAGAVQVEPSEVPVIEKIDAKILAAIEAGGTLNMDSWHTCETTHCRAGWAVHLAGERGYALERKVGSQMAGAMIYHASRPGKAAPWFFDSTDGALADIRACAAADPISPSQDKAGVV